MIELTARQQELLDELFKDFDFYSSISMILPQLIQLLPQLQELSSTRNFLSSDKPDILFRSLSKGVHNEGICAGSS